MPLRAVAGCLQILQRRYQGKLDASADELIAHSVDGSARMQTLIEGLLAFSRVGTRGGDFQIIEARDSVEHALKNLASVVNESQAEITVGPLPWLRVDPVQLTMLFQNLLGNALKFRGEAPARIHLGAVRDGERWQFSVRDNGIGIEPRHLERIFGLFQRLHPPESYSGTGVGLAICRKIVESHGGTIRAVSEPGQGSTFTFILPDLGDDA